MKSFSEYYEHYMSLHQNKTNRRLHVLGQVTTVLFVLTVVANSAWSWLILAPLVVYPFAWSGHIFFEKNKPAAWTNPLYAKASDWVMLKDYILGKVDR